MSSRIARRSAVFSIALATLIPTVGNPAIPAHAAAHTFAPEQRAGTPYQHQSNWEPTVGVDPNHANRIYQLITGINAHECSPGCPGTSVLFRSSTNGGSTWGPQEFVCGIACRRVGWQFDPQIQVAEDTNGACGCGTIYVVLLDTYNPGAVLFKSHDGGATWTAPITMNGSLSYMDKPALVISPTGKDVYVAFNGKLHNYVVGSHHYGDPGTFLAPQQVNGEDDLWWYADGAAIAPNGTVYFGENGETGRQLNVGHLDGPGVVGVLRCSPSRSLSCGDPTLSSFGTSAAPPLCIVFQCYPDYYAATASVAVDSAGKVMAAYTFTTVSNGPKSLYVRTSTNGVRWSSAKLVNGRGDSSVPQLANGPLPGDFRLAWQDDRTGAFNTWYSTTSAGGGGWSNAVKLSNLSSGAPYKSAAGYTFTDGDYFGIAVSSTGVTHAIWGEADGSSIYCCGDVWYTTL